MNNVLDLGIISIYYYSITMFIAIMMGLIVFFQETQDYDVDKKNFLSNLAFYGIIIGIVGARLYFVLFNLPDYLINPIEIFQTWNGGLAIHGGIICGSIFFIYYCRKYKENFLRIMDMASPGVILGQAIGRWGNFFNGEAHGGIVSRVFLEKLHLPNYIIEGMYINGNYYHPTFLYECIWNFIGFILLIIIRRHKKIRVGSITAIYLMWYSLGRFFIEGLRTDSLMFFSLRTAQVVSLLLFGLGLTIYILINTKDKYNKLYNVTDGQIDYTL